MNLFNVNTQYTDHEESVSPAGNEVTCPMCGHEYNRPVNVSRIAGNDNYEARSEGWNGRGDLVVVTMECEAGHTWDLCMGFHKGITTMFARVD